MDMQVVGHKIRRLLFIFLVMVSGSSWAAVETPWSTFGTGNQIIPNNNWPNYAGGYEFTPVVSGKISSLGGYFSGSRPVKLYETTSGTLLASTTITSSNNWVFANITPVNVVAGTSYTVAAESTTGTAMQTGLNFPLFPVTYGNITINRSVWGFPGSVPNIDVPGAMYGMADVGFEKTLATGTSGVTVTGNFANAFVIRNPANPGVVDAQLTLRNNTATDLSLYFPSAHYYDLLLINGSGQIVSAWSRGRLFSQVVTTVPLAAGTQVKLSASVPLTDDFGVALPAGGYTLKFVVNSSAQAGTAHPFGAEQYAVQSPFEIR